MVHLIARDTYNISPREGDDRRSHPGPLRENVTICPTQACTIPITSRVRQANVTHIYKLSIEIVRACRRHAVRAREGVSGSAVGGAPARAAARQPD